MARGVLILSIITMVTISMQPFTAKKIWLVLLGLICLSSASCFAESLYVNVSSTPYDRQMTRVRSILASRSTRDGQNVSLALVNHWIGELRGIPYGFSMEWKTPEEVHMDTAADCKAKAVALYDRMHSHGVQNVRLVIGKRMSSSRKTHTWLEWNTTTGTYVLDPTINWAACRADQAGRSFYIPLYAYAGARKYRATTAALFAKGQSLAGQKVASNL
jgi:predicted transglutaminase-like cysteine proteinase